MSSSCRRQSSVLGTAALGAGPLSKLGPRPSGLRRQPTPDVLLSQGQRVHLVVTQQCEGPQGVHLRTEAMVTRGQQGQLAATPAAGRSKGRLSLHRGATSKPATTASGADPILRLMWGSLGPKWALLSSCKKLVTQGKSPALESDSLYPKPLSALQSLRPLGKLQPFAEPFPYLMSTLGCHGGVKLMRGNMAHDRM